MKTQQQHTHRSSVPWPAVLALGGLLCVPPAAAHEMFLRAETAFLPAQSDQVVRLINGTFDKSDNSISRDRMASVVIRANGKLTRPPLTAWYDDANSSYLRFRAGDPGTYVIGVSTKPRIITLSRADFIAYLKHDGVLDTLASFEKSSKLTQVRERYSKHVRAFVQVGDARTADTAATLGFPIEIVFDQNPYTLKFGQDVSFRVLHRNSPVANQLVRASYEGFHGHDASGQHINAHTMRTDKNGRASFLISKKALWYVSLIYMQQVNEPQADYESNWATATFQVR